MKMKKFICLTLSLLMLCAVGCRKNNGGSSVDTSSSSENSVANVGETVVEPYTGGLHECTITDTGYEFIKNGVTNYKIVLPANATDNEKIAAQEINTFLLSSVGTKMETVTDEEVAFDGNAQYIFVGKTKQAEGRVSVSYEELFRDGFKIKTIDKSIFIVGAYDMGTVYGAYFFMEKIFGYRYYAVDEIKVNDVTDMTLPNIDITERPDFDYREGNYGEILRDETILRRSRMSFNGQIYYKNAHTSFQYLPPEQYKSEHRDWYSSSGTQLCYSNQEMIAQYIENIKADILEQGFGKVVMMGHEDNHGWCNCTACTASKQKYGVDSAVLIKFANQVSRAVNKWREENYPEEDPIRFLVFAYYATNDAPVQWNEEKQAYEPVAPEMVFDKNVGVYYAVPMDYQKTFQEAEFNANYYEQLKKWSSITDTIHYWSYSLYSWELMVPFNPYSAMQSNYITLLNNGVTSLLDQTKYMQGISPGFSRLHAFIDTQLMWNVNLSVEGLIDEFFPEYFKAASEPMRKYFDEMRLWYDYLYETTDFGGGWGFRCVKEEYWDKGTLERWLTYTQEAKDSILYLKATDNSLYEKLYKRIILEEVSIRYILIDLYRFSYSASVREQMMLDFYNDVTSMPMQTHEELMTFADLWSRWGLGV